MSIGAGASGRHTPVVLLPAPQAMLLLATFGMGLGLALDLHGMAPGALANLCVTGHRELWPTMQLHWALLPSMHVGMWTGGLATIPTLRALRRGCRRKYCANGAQNLACLACMTVGMSLGTLAIGHLGIQTGSSDVPLLAGMVVGMVGAMAANLAFWRLLVRLGPATSVEVNRPR